MRAEPFPAALREFLDLFNRGEYWESHEVLEGPWRENRSDFYKGLILLASAYVHVQRDNPRGILAQLAKAERHLEPYRPAYLGFDVDALLAHSARCREIVRDAPATLTTGWEARVPALRLRPAPERLRGDEPEIGEPG